jgi:hypothetical protein
MGRTIGFACAIFLCSASLTGCSERERPLKAKVEEEMASLRKLPSPADAEAFPADRQDAARAVAAALRERGEQPAEFHAEVSSENDGKVLVFHLWHDSAFEEQERAAAKGVFILGNPGGKCRNAYYDTEKKRVTQMLFWQ